jgi:predicted RNase H-like HicB family nuclease
VLVHSLSFQPTVIEVLEPFKMLIDYIQAAMSKAQFKVLEDGTIFGEIPPCQGVWSNAATEEEARVELQEGLEDWILLGVRLGHELPVIDGIDLNPQQQEEVA